MTKTLSGLNKSFLLGIGSYVPDRVLGNEELSKKVETSDEWIRTRTGIRKRRIASVIKRQAILH